MSNNTSRNIVNIQDFYQQARQKDFARQFQFRLTELANTNFGRGGVDWPMVYVESTTLPGRAITNVPVPYMGLQFNVPGTAVYPGSDGWTVNFRCDQNYDIRATLENATLLTFDDQSSTGDFNIARNSQNVVIQLLDKELQAVRTYTLYGAYVVSVGESQYSIGDNGQIVTVPATLAYQYWRASREGSYNRPAQDEYSTPTYNSGPGNASTPERRPTA